jgi:hypothetical protein
MHTLPVTIIKTALSSHVWYFGLFQASDLRPVMLEVKFLLTITGNVDDRANKWQLDA